MDAEQLERSSVLPGERQPPHAMETADTEGLVHLHALAREHQQLFCFFASVGLVSLFFPLPLTGKVGTAF